MVSSTLHDMNVDFSQLHDLVKTMGVITHHINEAIRLIGTMDPGRDSTLVGSRSDSTLVERSSTILSYYGSNPAPRSLKIDEPPRPARLAEASICDRSRPAHLFLIYDEYGEILCDDC